MFSSTKADIDRDAHRHKQLIAGLDAIRLISAIMVMAVHLCATSWRVEGYITQRIVNGAVYYPELLPFTWFGWVGVEIFFVISGFVISYSAEGRTACEFARSRILRLYPGALVSATVSLAAIRAFVPWACPRPMLSWLASASLAPVPIWVENVYWTLVVEIFFYSCIFLLLLTHNFQRLECASIALSCLSSSYWAGRLIFGSPGFGLVDQILRATLIHHGCFFAIGVIFYVIARHGLSWWRSLFGLTTFLCCLCEIECTSRSSARAFGMEGHVAVPACVFTTGLVLIATAIRCQQASYGSLFHLALRRVGVATYPLYLTHQTIGALILKGGVASGLGRFGALGVAFFLCIGLAVLIAEIAEPPIRALMRRAMDRVGFVCE